ncbi:MAG TPA: type II toxin-antitoxin system VapC family toxin [Mycobacteriales bacterium]|jgi:predicted nucleic acid-binding protein|nr:type II toxin-antitoxin system VapC family toxin [Mycobacteriales bacterium]
MTVIDANVVVAALVGSDDAASMAAAQSIGNAQTLHAPAHFVSEVLGAIRWLAAGKRITWDDADAAVDALPALGVRLHSPTSEDIGRAWELRHNITPQDALYVALAERLAQIFITADVKIGRANQARCRIQTP